jgi:hypothetical protein
MRWSAAVPVVLLVLGCQPAKGDRGEPGPPGPPGSPDTADQVLEKLNQAIAADGTLDLQRSSVSAVIGPATFSVPPNEFVTVPYSNIVHDKLRELNPGTSRFTATSPGEYLVCASLSSVFPDTTWELDLFINGSRERTFVGGNPAQAEAGCRPTHLEASDFLEVKVAQSMTGVVVFIGTTDVSWLTIQRID